MSVRQLTAVSLFSGCGGLDLGIQQAGFKLLLASDNDSDCAGSHQANFPATPFLQCSIDELSIERAATATQGEPANSQVDLLIGGPPCPPFSKSRFYRPDKPRALADPTGALTIAGYLDVLRWLRPRAFILENVPGLAYAVHGEALAHITSEAAGLGYRCAHRIINAADFGVPQIRQRLFVVGTADNLDFSFPNPTHADPKGNDLFSNLLPPWVTAGEAIGDLDTEANADDAGHFAGGKHHDLLRQIPPGDNYLFLTAKRGHAEPQFVWRSRYWSFLLKLSPELPSWTIQARRSNNMGPFHWRNRILRIAEIKRLQAFPDSWVLAGRIESQWRQVGNAVPPPLAQQLGRAVADALASSASDTRLPQSA